MRGPDQIELSLLQLVADQGGSMSHDDERLAPFCSDESTLSEPDVFNRCHDLNWLKTWRDDRTDSSRVELTERGRAALA